MPHAKKYFFTCIKNKKRGTPPSPIIWVAWLLVKCVACAATPPPPPSKDKVKPKEVVIVYVNSATEKSEVYGREVKVMVYVISKSILLYTLFYSCKSHPSVGGDDVSHPSARGGCMSLP
jgi:hypothetical protein